MRLRSQNFKPRSRGITLIELMVVLALLALAMTLVGPAVGNTVDNLRFRTFGRQLQHSFRRAQAQSRLAQEEHFIALNSDRLVVFDRGEAILEEIVLPAGVSAGSARDGAYDGVYVVSRSGHILGPQRLDLTSSSGRSGAIVIDGYEARFVEGER